MGSRSYQENLVENILQCIQNIFVHVSILLHKHTYIWAHPLSFKGLKLKAAPFSAVLKIWWLWSTCSPFIMGMCHVWQRNGLTSLWFAWLECIVSLFSYMPHLIFMYFFNILWCVTTVWAGYFKVHKRLYVTHLVISSISSCSSSLMLQDFAQWYWR